MDAATSYYLRKYYPHVIKWWLVDYNPEAKRVWPSKAEEEEALRLEVLSLPDYGDEESNEETYMDTSSIDDSAYNATTGSYSGLYGQKPVDESTQQALDSIMSMSAQSNQLNIDSLLAGAAPEPESIEMDEEQLAVIEEANAIYERLMREAAEDEARKIAEIKAACGQEP